MSLSQTAKLITRILFRLLPDALPTRGGLPRGRAHEGVFPGGRAAALGVSQVNSNRQRVSPGMPRLYRLSELIRATSTNGSESCLRLIGQCGSSVDPVVEGSRLECRDHISSPLGRYLESAPFGADRCESVWMYSVTLEFTGDTAPPGPFGLGFNAAHTIQDNC